MSEINPSKRGVAKTVYHYFLVRNLNVIVNNATLKFNPI